MTGKLKLHHIGIYVNDMEESVDFYEKVLGFRTLFKSLAYEGDKPLNMTWIKNPEGVVIELLSEENKDGVEATKYTPNHICLSSENTDKICSQLEKHNIQYDVKVECLPFTTELSFDRQLSNEDKDLFGKFNHKGTYVKIFFFRGPNNERFEIMESNIGGLEEAEKL